ncbi:conjugal transfer protein TrbD [Acinetobacter baumannii]|uniref:conjugal transfer protein TrbD n=1 Tax=Acinetobacter baumannii TaxID=470 RepID=UPI000DF18F05|nr:conjugal transfer protein TrbD [Acinetobacter baumannii]RCT89696.1 hypothetical protein DVA68_15985 [Acinetobacter baumannii]
MASGSTLRRSVINRSLNRPNLLLGCEREWILMAGLIAFALIFSLKTIPSIIIGVILWFISLFLLRKMGKADPLASKVYIRHIKQQKLYLPKSTPFRKM